MDAARPKSMARRFQSSVRNMVTSVRPRTLAVTVRIK